MWHDLLLETRASPRLTQCGHKITDLQIYIYIYIKPTYFNHPNKIIEHPILRITRILVQQK